MYWPWIFETSETFCPILVISPSELISKLSASSKGFSNLIFQYSSQFLSIIIEESWVDKINFLSAKKLFNDGLKEIFVSNVSLYGKFLHKDIKIDDEILKIGTELNDTLLNKIISANILTIEVSTTNSINKGPYLLQTVINDKNDSKNDDLCQRGSCL